MRIQTIFQLIVLLFLMSCSSKENRTSPQESDALKSAFRSFPSIEKKAKHKVLTLGTFHFDRSLDGSDIVAKNQIDITSVENQKQIDGLVQILKEFKPTKIAVEWIPDVQNKMDSIYMEYVDGNWELRKNEAFQIGFRLAKLLQHERIYCVDNNPPMPESINSIDDLDLYAENIGHSELWHTYDNENQNFNTFMDTIQNGLFVMDYLKLMNSKPYATRTKQIWTTGLVNVGHGDTYIGADFLGRWYRRNVRIFANTSNLAKSDSENVLVIYGAAHKWVLDELYESAPDFEVVQLEDIIH